MQLVPPNVSIMLATSPASSRPELSPTSGSPSRQSWEDSRIEHHIAARKAFGAYVAVTTEVRAADLRRSQEFARRVRRFLARRS